MFTWDEGKNIALKQDRGIGFEDILLAIEEEKVHDVIPHHDQVKYPHQKIYVVEVNGYTHYVPFVQDGENIFLKTIIPSRKYHKKYHP